MNTNSSGPMLLGAVMIGSLTLWMLSSSKSKVSESDRNVSNNKDSKTSEVLHESTVAIVNPPISEKSNRYHPGLHDLKYKDCVYCDYNATTPIYVEVNAAITPYLTSCFGNPSSSHMFGKPCKQALLNARENISKLINARLAEEIYFTSCGTESDNRAIDTAIFHYQKRRVENQLTSTLKPKIISCAIEHPAILAYLKQLFLDGVIELTILPVNNEGFIDLKVLAEELSENTALVTIMHSNNEVGTIQPFRRISKIIQSYNSQKNVHILLHSDAAQSIGKVMIDVQSLNIDMVTIVGHKYGAPKGIAALYVREGVTMKPMLYGGGQERGKRGGTENVPFCVALGEASRIAFNESESLLIHYFSLKSALLQRFSELLHSHAGRFIINGPARSRNYQHIVSDIKMIKLLLKPSLSMKSSSSIENAYEMVEQLPNTISISFENLLGHEIVEKLSHKVACSAGSACHSVSTVNSSTAMQSVPSHVLVAMDIPATFALGTVRLSFGRYSTLDEVNVIADSIAEVVKVLWRNSDIVDTNNKPI